MKTRRVREVQVLSLEFSKELLVVWTEISVTRNCRVRGVLKAMSQSYVEPRQMFLTNPLQQSLCQFHLQIKRDVTYVKSELAGCS